MKFATIINRKVSLFFVIFCMMLIFLVCLFTMVPDTRHHKLLMPGNHNLFLREDTYTVWLYPGWEKVDQEKFPSLQKMMNMEHQMPYLSVESGSGDRVKIHMYKSRVGGGSLIYKMRIAKFKIKHSGMYSVKSSSMEAKKNFVLAIVPSAAYDPDTIETAGRFSSFFPDSEARKVELP